MLPGIYMGQRYGRESPRAERCTSWVRRVNSRYSKGSAPESARPMALSSLAMTSMAPSGRQLREPIHIPDDNRWKLYEDRSGLECLDFDGRQCGKFLRDQPIWRRLWDTVQTLTL